MDLHKIRTTLHSVHHIAAEHGVEEGLRALADVVEQMLTFLKQVEQAFDNHQHQLPSSRSADTTDMPCKSIGWGLSLPVRVSDPDPDERMKREREDALAAEEQEEAERQEREERLAAVEAASSFTADKMRKKAQEKEKKRHTARKTK